jgi:adenylosuccinate synthase
MSGKVISLSGPIGSGKSTLAGSLTSEYGAVLFKTNELIADLRPGAANDRKAMQEAGDALDRATGGQWVREALIRRLDDLGSPALIVVDAVRIRPQIDGIRQALGDRVYHIHLTAGERELSRRYRKRAPKVRELASFEEARANQTERDIEQLANAADILVSTERCTERDVLVRAVARLGLYPRVSNRLVDVLVGGQWGSEGKGNVVAHIAPEYRFLRG